MVCCCLILINIIIKYSHSYSLWCCLFTYGIPIPIPVPIPYGCLVSSHALSLIINIPIAIPIPIPHFPIRNKIIHNNAPKNYDYMRRTHGIQTDEIIRILKNTAYQVGVTHECILPDS